MHMCGKGRRANTLSLGLLHFSLVTVSPQPGSQVLQEHHGWPKGLRAENFLLLLKLGLDHSVRKGGGVVWPWQPKGDRGV